MADNKRMLTAKVLITLACATVLTACGHGVAPVGTDSAASTGAGSGSGSADQPTAPLPANTGAPAETQPTTASTDPVDGPANLPPMPAAPTTPVAPSQMEVRACAETLTTLPAPGLSPIELSVIRSKLTWTPVKGATSYKIYSLAKTATSQDGDKGKLCYSLPGWAPIAIVGGGLGGFGNLNVGQEYDYTVDALDRAGNIIAEGQDNDMPLAPLDIPVIQGPAQNATHVGATPEFSWTPSRGADGYYCEVFSTLRSIIPAVPMWRGFRGDTDASDILYGTQVDVMPGTAPMQWSLPLNVGSRYAWMVTAIRTDTHDMSGCKAIARANTPIYYFLP